ncbi:unnamed protein product [Miscanthus lutarioriparius]|uniref:Ferritin n=1 Tax=Miscanthus lutarioriparius TaxID=422564 RepID=A0A811Q7R9_9POAL|nr:unnamed protein product [Miscanthus lutarioriparius]
MEDPGGGGDGGAGAEQHVGGGGAVATRCNDPQLTDFIEREFLEEQVEAINKISKYVAQLRRVGKGHGVWHFDQMLLEEEV